MDGCFLELIPYAQESLMSFIIKHATCDSFLWHACDHYFFEMDNCCLFLCSRPADRTGEDLDIIFSRLRDLKAFEKFHPLLLQQICYYSYYEDLEQGVICESLLAY